jgi:nucleoside-diphosphate-sugar epimerase
MASLRTVADVLGRLVPSFAWTIGQPRPAIAGVATERRGPMNIRRLTSIGFEPRFSLEEGLADTLKWVRSFHAAGISMSDEV